MAYSRELIDYATDTSGATANVSVIPYDNCHTIIVYNTDATDAVLVGIVANGTALTTANAATIPAGGSITLRIGTAEYRPFGSFGVTTRMLRLAAVANTPVVSFQMLNSTQAVAP
jgi:hypothetical protein